LATTPAAASSTLEDLMKNLFRGLGDRLTCCLIDAAGGERGLAPRLEALEGRSLLAASILTAVPDSVANLGSAATVVNLAGRYDDPALNGTIVKFATDVGDINVLLYDQANTGVSRTTPQTVANFLRYMNDGKYAQTIFHRSAANFVVQGGGFTRPALAATAPAAITTYAAVVNEPGNTNTRGTIAMAKVGGNPNSATSQWFFNLGNNAANLDAQNGGFTVFGRVIKGLDVMDAIAAVPVWDFGGSFTELPLRNHVQNSDVQPSSFVGMAISAIGEMTYSVTTSNSAVVNPTLSGTNVTLSYGTAGTATVTVRATSADGTFVDDVFTVRVNAAPSIAGLAATPSNVGRNSPFSLSLGSATDDAGIARVDFYRDVNGNGQLDLDVDSLVGSDTSSEGGWRFNATTEGLGLGQHRFLARAIDSDGLFSTVSSTTLTVVNAGPVVSAFAASPNPASGRVPVTLTAAAADADGTVAFVRFYRDSNNNGTLDIGTDALLGEDADGSNGYSLAVDTSSFTFGAIRYFAQGTDVEGQTGDAASVVGLINAPFAVGRLTPSATQVSRGGQVTLVAGDVFIPAGKRLKAVEFYADTNRNGVFDANVDRKVGSAGSLRDGTASARVATRGVAAGQQSYFVRVQDNLGDWTPATSASVAIVNNAPVVATVKATPAIVKNRGDLVTLSTGGIRDVDGRVTSVTYYLDLQNRVPPFGAPPDWPVNSLPAMIVLGTATNASGGWKLAVSTAQFNTGANQIYAVATDNDGATSRFVGAACVVNAAPTIESFTVTPDAGTVAATSFTFAAGGVADANGTVRQVEFFLDVNGNGTLDSRIDKSLGKGRLIDGVWSMTLGPKKLPAGTLTLLARATDNAGGFSAVRTAEVTLT
jgi:cyclophilin family peptidyl-prolyl cis-trans isomerase